MSGAGVHICGDDATCARCYPQTEPERDAVEAFDIEYERKRQEAVERGEF